MIALTGLVVRLDEIDGIGVTTEMRAGRMIFAIGRDSGEAQGARSPRVFHVRRCSPVGSEKEPLNRFR
jgi:hypothetical protein